MPKKLEPAPSGLGRPRRFDSATEQKLLMDAGIKVMSEGNFLDVSVTDVLSEAGLSTRAFYRHFESKETLLIAIMRRDAEAVGKSLDRAIALANDPATAIERWLDGYLAVFYEPRRARRTTLYVSPGAQSSSAVISHYEELRRLITRPLEKALRAGHREKILHSPSPRRDALTIVALVSASIGTPSERRPQQAARENVVRFAWPALGIPIAR